MHRYIVALATTITLIASGSAHAGWNDFWYGVHVDFHRNNCWPEPFAYADRELSRAPLIAMTDAGWRLQNTLSHHFFDPETQTLTQAGVIKLRWIATQTPLHRRAVFVLRAIDPNATSARMLAVEQQLDLMLASSDRPEVLITDRMPPGGSGDYFNAVDQQMKSSIPAPRLPDVQGGNGGG